MHPETRLALHHVRAAELRAQADAYRLAAAARRSWGLRTRLGWTLVEVGLRLAAAPKPASAAQASYIQRSYVWLRTSGTREPTRGPT